MNQEEILLKVGLDGSGFDQNITKTETRLEQFGEHAHNSFLHAERPARAFHHLMGEIGSRVPFLAEGFQALINPTTGVIALVGAGFALVSERFKEFGKTMDEIGAKNAKSIEINREGLAALAREQKEFQKSLNIDPVTGITKAVAEEKDPGTRLSQARQNRDRFAAERDKKLQELKSLAERERRLTAIPGVLKSAQELLESIEATPAESFLPGVFMAGQGGLESIGAFGRSRSADREARILALQGRIGALKAELGTPERLKEITERRIQLQSEIQARSKAVGELQGIIDPLAPLDALPRGKRGATFHISGPGGEFSGAVGGNAQDIKNYLKQIAESPWVKNGEIKVPNGP